MSKLFALQTDTTLSCLQHHKLKLHHHHHIPKNHFLKPSLAPSLLNSRKGFSKICCNIKEKENLAENGERIVSGLKIAAADDDDEFGDVGNGKVLGFDNMDWPPWKNVPQRYKMIGTTSLAFVICNMDKVNLSIAIIPMSHQFGWSSSVAGLVQSSFFWGYAMSQLPGGWLSKIFGGRVILQFGVLAWSLATALVPLVAGFMPGLVLSRILVGIGEGVSPSAATDLIARLIPLEERSRAVSFVFGGLSVGSVLGLLLAPPLIESFGWESVFYMFGSFGIMWFLGFQFVAEDQPSTNSASLSRSQSNHKAKSWETSMEEFGGSLNVPWRSFFQSKAVWAMIYAHFCGSWGHYCCLSWLPTYFSEELNLNLTEAAWVSVLPPLASVVVTSFASQFADKLISSGVETTVVRKICQTIAFLSPAACMILSSVDLGLPPWEVVTILTGGIALSSFALSGLYCTHQDISPEYASILLVYEGHIKIENSSSITVAIKRFESISNQGIPEFMAEIETLSKLRHAHLVSLLGYCNDDQEMIIVYEYMSRGSLYDHLHKSNTPLSWSQRLKISLGAARGLDYLHTGAGTKHGVVHRDVKSTNILLDEDWEAKISDFGLAKNFPINQSSTYVQTGIKGTFGYMDPEIFMTGKFTRKTDVFAFGVVMFELLSGRQAVHVDGDEDLSLAVWAQNCVKNRNLDEVVAVELRREVSTKSLKEFSQIAYRCLNSDPKERPTMSEIVVALQLLESSPEKFEDCAKPAGIFGLTWTMPTNYLALPKSLTKMSLKSIGDGYIKSLMNSNNNSDCSSSVPSEDSEVLSGNEQMQAQELKIFSYTDLERSTSKFKKCIFEVGQHCVFKGWVHERNYSPSKRGVGLAITVMYFEHRPKHVQLERELQVMGEFRHPNLQRLLGYCLEGEKFYLVHELIEKRTLKDYLKGSAQELPFIMRVKIAIGVVSGLVFLHHKQMIDEIWSLSTDYIRIDKDFNAKISYFDLARLVRRESVSGSGNSGAQCDIRDLGYLLMEMLRGKSMGKKEQINLGKRKHYLSGEISNMSDEMIRKVVDRRIKLSVPLTERSRELLYIIQNCIGQGYSLEQALDDLEQIYSRMTRK